MADRNTSPLSSAQSPTAESSAKKRFVCSWPGCNKSFGRSEHLHRHALNHKEGDNTCTRCAAHFRRRDLLDRHMQRHKEKDDEAGGPGLGVLATRKRLWKDANGNIVNDRRPNLLDASKRRQLESSEDGVEEGDTIGNTISPSPPFSGPSTSGHLSNGIGPDMGNDMSNDMGNVDMMPETWPPTDMDFSPQNFAPGVDINDLAFLSNSSWGNQTFEGLMDGSDLPYDDIFKPDTAMPFNAPFTTMSYYSWLFEIDGNAAHNSSLLPTPPGLVSSISSSSSSLPTFGIESRMPNIYSGGMDPTALPYSNKSNIEVPYIGGDFNYSFVSPIGDPKNDLNMNIDSTSTFSGSSYLQPNSYQITPQTPRRSTPQSQRSGSITSYLLPDSFTPTPTTLPVISQNARDGLMQLINQSQLSRPDGTEITPSDPLLSLYALQHYCNLFFTGFNSAYPLIHQATFEPSTVHSIFLMSIVLLGATYSDKEAHSLAVCVHDIMRPLIHGSSEFSTRPSLWMLQTIVLVEVFGKCRAGDKQHDMSQLYNGLLITLIRNSDYQTASIPAFDEQTSDLEHYWHRAVEAEQKRRLAMFCFAWDTQRAVLFSQSPLMNASELKLPLPWDPAVWDASNATEWLSAISAAPYPPQYLAVLKMYASPNGSSPPPHLNALSRCVILHGLVSVACDLSRRDQTSINIAIPPSSLPWQSRISNSYDRWKSDFDIYSSSVLSSLSFSPEHQVKFQRFTVAKVAIYHTAKMILEADVIDLQIYAGARHIIGRPVTDFDRRRSENQINEWIQKDNGRSAGRAAWHSARLLRDGIRKLENWDAGDMFHYPWCLYLSTLMCWTLHHWASRAQGNVVGSQIGKTQEIALVSQSDQLDDEDIDWDAKAEMNAFISGLTRLDPEKEFFLKDMWYVAGNYKTAGLIRCMVKHLNTIRWAVVREGMIVLRRLVDT